ncbi:MAG TPA: ArsA family ATPase [Candidatus Binatia bacterium]|nr:ArsA family ATPase [Candidatus Binatia bacterium]
MPRFSFFIGKGGVGKTTVSSAWALDRAAAQPRARILLLSTDPAHSLADVLEVRLTNSATRLRCPGRLWARQIDPDRQIGSFLQREREDLLALLNKGSLFTGDELEPLLDTSLPGMAEVAALLAVHELLDAAYDEVVVDTAPMGHAIRLFQMPEHFARFLDVLETAASRDVVLAEHFGGHARREPALDRWTRMVQQVEETLSAGGSRLLLVTTPEPFSLREAARSASAFHAGAPRDRIAAIVLNRVVSAATKCPRCRKLAAETAAARKFLRTHFPQAKVFSAGDPGCPILGIGALRAFGAHFFAGKKLPRSLLAKPGKAARVQLLPAAWPRLATPLTLTLGKGGVGKTTLSAALAYHQRTVAQRERVTICSIDPAPSLQDVFSATLGDEPQPVLGDRNLLAAEFDAMAQFRQWTGQLRSRLNEALSGEERGIHLDLSLDRRFLLALLDVVPPGVDEIFATFRILDLLEGGGRVLIDMAPTGHALELLRTPARVLAWARLLLKTLAAHRTLPFARDAAVEVATVSQKVRELASMLRDRRRSRIVVVTLPEPLPDYETRRLLRTLRELQAPIGSVFVNRVLTGAGGCSRCQLAAQWQAASLATLRRQLRGHQILVAREFDAPIAGQRALRQFTRELWRLK